MLLVDIVFLHGLISGSGHEFKMLPAMQFKEYAS